MKERLDDVEAELSKHSKAKEANGGGGDDVEALRKDVDFIMGRAGEETGDISGIPSLVID